VRDLGRQPALDGVRGIAVLAVLATHFIFLNHGVTAWSLPGGFLGVDVFLVLSGFLIGSVLMGEVERTGSIDGPGFAGRRARRLIPPLAVLLAVQAAVALSLGATWGEQLLQAFLALTFTSNWQLSFGHHAPFELVHLWSLSLEGQFYALMALLIWCLRGRLRHPIRIIWGLVAGSLVVAVWRLYLYRHGVSPEALYERTGTRLDSLLLGIAAALVWRTRLVSDSVLRIAGVVGLAVLAAASVIARPLASWLFEGGFTVVAAAAGTVVAAAATEGGPVSWLAGRRSLRWIGGISFSLYLWHLPIYIWTVRALPAAPLWATAAIAVPTSFIAAMLSFRFVESRTLATWRGGRITAPGDSDGRTGIDGRGQRQSASDTPGAADTE
jgi:peptidoglycan/LPS O-acetylase OafA/YrhL